VVGNRTRRTKKGKVMTETSLDELCPVDYVVVEFPAGASNFTGGMAKELLALVDAGTSTSIHGSRVGSDETRTRGLPPRYGSNCGGASFGRTRP
jgi:hypothetical protein